MPQDQNEDRPINLEESTVIELNREIVTEDSPSTVVPVWKPRRHAGNDKRELLHQPFESETVE